MVDQYPLIRGHFRGRRQVAYQFGSILDDFHSPAAQHITGAHDYRIANILGYLQGFGYRSHRRARRLGDAQPGKKFLELLPVGGDINSFCAGTQNRQAGVGQGLGQVDGSLAAELDY